MGEKMEVGGGDCKELRTEALHQLPEKCEAREESERGGERRPTQEQRPRMASCGGLTGRRNE